MQNETTEKLSTANITDIMQSAYIEYSMSVIVSRALPDARDGLKPVQRRVLYAMLREGLLHNRPFTKCAGVVGEVLKNYHPHGDSSVYDTLVRLAQPWVVRYLLVDPQGNFGSIDGDSAAAYRYTECRLKKLAEVLLDDIEENTVDFQPNYNESTTEPTVLPCALPHLLMNGSTGIAVGMATNVPPHNLRELAAATVAIIDNPQISIDELCTYIKGPDFPTGGIIVGTAAIESYLRTGRGIVRVRGRMHVEETSSGGEHIVVTEIPYNVNRASLVTHIAQLVTDKQLEGIRDIRDESDENTRIVIEIKRGEQSRVIINQLYKKTALESSFGANMLALDNKRPKLMNIREMLDCYVDHRREVITRRTQFRLKQAEDRAHILEGYKIALDNLDDFVRIIRASSGRQEAKERLMAKYPLSERQTDAILELRLYQLTGLEREKIDAEYMELMTLITGLKEILESQAKLDGVIKDELNALVEQYGDARRTEITYGVGDFRMEDVIPNEGCVITVSHLGFIKRTPVTEYRSQKRGGKGIIGTDTYEEDFVQDLFTAETHDYILFLTTKGQALAKKVYEIPEGARTSKGKSVKSFLAIDTDEKIAAMICVKEFSKDLHLVMATKNGITKKTNLADYSNATREGGLIGIKLEENDDLVGCVLTNGENEIMLVSHQGLAVRFKESDLRDQGRGTVGVTGMRFKREGDFVEAIEVCDPNARLLVAREDGIGKRSPFEDYRLTRRGSSGVIAIDLPDDGSVMVAGALSVRETDEIMILTKKGQSIRCPVRDIRETGRNAKGVKLVDLAARDKVLSIAKIVESDEELEAAGNDTEEGTPAEETPTPEAPATENSQDNDSDI